MKGFACIMVVLFFISCKKQNDPGEVNVRLSATTFYKNGAEETHFERSGTINRSSYGELVNDGTSNKYLVNLGAAGTAPNLSTFGVSFLFNQKTIPDSINGDFSFPKDQLLVRVMLRNEINLTSSETIFFPTRGTVNFSYDKNNHTINGSIQDMEFNIAPNDPFGRYRVTIKGTFMNVPIH